MTLWVKILVRIGIRSKCHGAKIVTLYGWDYRSDSRVCSLCGRAQ